MPISDEVIIEQSGAIPYRISGDRMEILLITSSSGRRWIIPKGLLEEGMTPGESAEKEAFEEAGVLGRASKAPIGSYSWTKWGGVCRVQVFALRVDTTLDAWPERHMRKRQWIEASEAAQWIEDPDLVQLVVSLPRIISLLPIQEDTVSS